MATMMGSYAALGMLGLVLMRKNKIGILTVSFKDPLGDLQQPQFAFIPRTVKEVNLIDDIAKRESGSFLSYAGNKLDY